MRFTQKLCSPLLKWPLLLGLLTALPSCALLTAHPKKTTPAERWAALPSGEAPLAGPVTVRWNDYAVPYIEATTDEDAAFALGLVHAHLRLGQMALVRKMAQGRAAEMAGPFGVDIDKTVRTLDLPKAARAMEAALSSSTRKFVERFVDGINYYRTKTKERPTEFSALLIEDDPWTVSDILLLARLGSFDINLGFYNTFFRLGGSADGEALFATYRELGGMSPPSYPAEGGALGLENVVTHMTRSGSNSIAISGKKSATGAALLANDPHLGIFAPNMWLLVGLRSPSYHVVGLMFPALPFFGIGRNERVSWGGTNMRGISSHLYRVDERTPVTERTERITVRDYFDTKVTIRETPLGPILSGTPFFPREEPKVALYWAGYEPSDEFSAFLGAARAQSWTEFRSAFATYGVSAQNILYADADGHIGQVLAYRQPLLAEPDKTLDLYKAPTNRVVRLLSPLEQPEIVDPPSGVIASANNLPTKTAVPLAFAYASPDRVQRLQELAAASPRVTVEDLKAWQNDVFSRSSLDLTREVVRRCPDLAPLSEGERATYAAFASFDGQYRAEAKGPVAFESVLYHLARTLLKGRYHDESVVEVVLKGDFAKRVTMGLMADLPNERLCPVVREAVQLATESFEKFPTWGTMHVQRFQHPFGFLPLIGSRFVVGEFEAPGGNETLLRAAHRLSADKVTVTYGASARHVSDMSDPDANYFVLFGGQDGWLSSDHLADQLELWKRGAYIRMPLRTATIRSEFVHEVALVPMAKAR